jgi:hypothetical protein
VRLTGSAEAHAIHAPTRRPDAGLENPLPDELDATNFEPWDALPPARDLKLGVPTGVVEKDDGVLRDEVAHERYGGKAGTSRGKRGAIDEDEFSAPAVEGPRKLVDGEAVAALDASLYHLVDERSGQHQGAPRETQLLQLCGCLPCVLVVVLDRDDEGAAAVASDLTVERGQAYRADARAELENQPWSVLKNHLLKEVDRRGRKAPAAELPVAEHPRQRSVAKVEGGADDVPSAGNQRVVDGDDPPDREQCGGGHPAGPKSSHDRDEPEGDRACRRARGRPSAKAAERAQDRQLMFTTTGAETRVFPAASAATAVSVYWPRGSLFVCQLTKYGELVLVPISAPFA